MGNIIANFGPMGSAKSANLIINAFNLIKQGKKIEVLRPITDTRGTPGRITSRLPGLADIDCIDFHNLSNFKLKPETQFIILEECQFCSPADYDILAKLSIYNDIEIHAYGLKIDSNGNLFEGSRRLIELNPIINHFYMPCQMPNCKGTATHSLRYSHDHKLIRGGPAIMVGDHIPQGKNPGDLNTQPYYKSVCFECFFKHYYNEDATR